MRFDVVTVGNYTEDTIVSAAGTRRVPGGGFAYAAHAARVAGVRVAAVTRLAPADAAVLEPLQAAGVEVFARASARSTRLRLEYPTADPDDRVVTATEVADPIRLEDVRPADGAAFVVNASLRGEIGDGVLELLRKRARLLALDVQGFLRVAGPGGRLAHREWPDAARVLPMLDVVKTDAVEAALLTGRPDPRDAARALAALGAREVLLTHAAGVLVLAGGEMHEAPFRPRALVGRSGRGDTCVGAYVSKRLAAGPAESVRWAAAVTTLKLEAEGPIRRPAADVLALLAAGDPPRRA